MLKTHVCILSIWYYACKSYKASFTVLASKNRGDAFCPLQLQASRSI